MNKHTVLLIGIICLLSLNLLGQQELSFMWNKKCDTLLIQSKIINSELGKLQCLKDPGRDRIIYFTKKEEFENYVYKNKISKKYCLDKPGMTFDFDKYDVVLIRISIGGCGLPKYDYKTFESKENYIISINFYSQEIICAEKNIFSRYILLPKGKANAPKFNICNL